MVSPGDEQKRLWAYRIDPAATPKEIDLITQFDTILKGIYMFEGDRLSSARRSPRRRSRPASSRPPAVRGRVLYTFKMVKPEPAPTRTARPAAPPEPTPEEQARLREQKIRDMLVGSWSMTDSRGSLVTVFRADGTFSSTRTMTRKRLSSRPPSRSTAAGASLKAGQFTKIRTDATEGR